MNLQVRTKSTLGDIEELSRQLPPSREDIQIWLPTNLGPQLFKETWLVSLLALTAASRRLTVVDWISKSDVARDSTRFGTTLEGLASIVYADTITNSSKEPASLDREGLLWAVVEREGIAELAGRGHSLTFCAIDNTEPSEPIAFQGLDEKDRFVSELIEYRRRYFEIGAGEDYSTRVGPNLFDRDAGDKGAHDLAPSDDRVLAGFVFEIYRNSLEHGCLDRNGNVIHGLRYVRLKKHIDYDKRKIMERALGFAELQNYFEQVAPEAGTFKFYEIAISDHGLGIIDRFLATRPEFRLDRDTVEDRIQLINTIIEQALSSKQTQSGAGYGLKRALSAVNKLRGFISLRTDRLWLYSSFGQSMMTHDKPTLVPVTSFDNLARIPGTHFNMLVPLS